jgi:hypothetical protein
MSDPRENQGLFDTSNSRHSENGLRDRLQADINTAGGENVPEVETVGAIGVTMFDLPGSEDQTVTVLLPHDNIQHAPSQSLVRIKSRKDGDSRTYLGIVSAGPFSARKTRFRLLAKPSRMGLVTHRIPTKGFRVASYVSSSFPKLA